MPLEDDIIRVYRNSAEYVAEQEKNGNTVKEWEEKDAENLLSSLQITNSDMQNENDDPAAPSIVTTLNGKTLQNISAGTFAGGSLGGGSEVLDTYGYILNDGTKWFKVGGSENSLLNDKEHFAEVTYSAELGGYVYGTGENAKLVEDSSVYFIQDAEGIEHAGVFLVNGQVYNGSVYGENNEILVTGKDDEGYHSYWGTEFNNPQALIGDKMTVGQFNETISRLNGNIEAIHEDDIQKVEAAKNEEGNGGSLNFITYGQMEAVTDQYGNIVGYKKAEDGTTAQHTIGITGVVGKDGQQDIQFTAGEQSFTVDAGSLVTANPKTEGTDAGTLSTISINGQNYVLKDIHVTGGYIDKSGFIYLQQDGITTPVNLKDPIHDYVLIANPAEGSNGAYKVDDEGNLTLTVQDQYGGDTGTITLSGIASTSALENAAAAAKTEVAAGQNTHVTSTTESEENDGHTIYTVDADKTTVSADENNFTVTPTKDETTYTTDYNIKLNDVVTIGGTDEGEHAVRIDGEAGLVSGLTNTTWNPSEDNTYSQSDKAATEAQLNTVWEEALKHSIVEGAEDGHIMVTPTETEDGWKYTLNTTGLLDFDLTGLSEKGKSVIRGLEQHIAPGTYSFQDDGTLTLEYVDGNGNLIANQSLKITGLASDADVEAAKVTIHAGHNTSIDYDEDNNIYTVHADGTTVSGDGTGEQEGNILVQKGDKDENDVTDYRVSLNDDLTLGGKEGQDGSISISGSTGVITVKNVTGETSSSIEIGGGRITGLTNEIEDWSTFVSPDSSAKESTSAATLAELYELSQHSVFYAMNGSAIDYGTINLANAYNSDKSGGTFIYNVAYAQTAEGDNYNGSAAVNVDLLKDYVGNAVDDAKTEMQSSDQHLVANPAEGSDGKYTVSEDHTVDLIVGTTNKNGNVTTTDTVTIEDVASATDLGSVDKFGNGNDIESNNVVDAVIEVNNKVGTTQYAHSDGSKTTYVEAGQDDVTTAIGKLDEVIGGLASDVEEATTEAGKHSSVSEGNGITITKTDATDTAGTDYKVSLADDFTLGGKEEQTGRIEITGSTGTISATGNINAGSFTTDGGFANGGISIGKNSDGQNVVSGLGNTKWNADNFVSGQAATEDQLQQATEAAVQYDRKEEDGSVDKGNITLGYKDGEGTQQYTTIHNVANGEDDYDAVNVSQLKGVESQVINNSMNISYLENSVRGLDNRIDRVGAGAAALAALQPLDFDPDAKWDFAAGYGNYRSANAVAVGAYYRPNEDVMFSIGGSMGGGENMMNAGVSVKLGSGSSHVTTSRTAMAKEIKDLREAVAKQDAQIRQLTALVQTLAGVKTDAAAVTDFPDVPENHWAYEAVHDLARRGLVEGYPDGSFGGDRTLTRYEFAQIVYNALQKGAAVDSRLVDEFSPELTYFRIDTVETDDAGRPVIQRVRANRV